MADQQNDSVFDSHEFVLGQEGGFQSNDIFGRYRIERSLGCGAMATVMLATDTVLGRKVALKVPLIKPEANDRVTQKRFLREAKAAALLSHPNICPIHDVGVVDNSLYISMAYVEGISLVQVIEETERFEEREVAQIIRSIASAVAEAHHQGIVHRDLKPGNIMIDRRGEPVVLDFGLASFYKSNEDSMLTMEGHAIGTPSYMSPEQAVNDGELTPATDIFSLGIIFWELLTGERLYSGETMAILGEIVHGELSPPSSRRPDLSPDMEAICLKALSKDPQDRYRSMDEFVTALEDWLKMRGVNVIGGSGSGVLIESHAEMKAHDFEAVLDQTRHEIEVVSRMREQRWMLVIAVLAVIIGVLLYLLWGQANRFPEVDTANATAGSSDASVSNVRSPDMNSRPPRPGMSTGEMFDVYDGNRNDRLELHEFPGHIIRRADRNRDDSLSREELQRALEEMGGKALIRPPNGPAEREFLPPPDSRRPPPNRRPPDERPPF